jgi:peptide/nickel transport system permease protein
MTSEQQDIRSIKTRRTLGETVLRLLKSAPYSALFGMAVIAFYAFCALFAPLIAPYGESEIVGKAYGAATSQNWFGLDQIGRDTFSRVLFGARNTIGIALLTVLISFCIGGVLGIYAAVTRGWLDQIVSRVVDVLMSIPVLIFALMLLAMAGKSVWNLIFILALLDSTRVFRLARNTALSVVVQDFVEAARLRGEKLPWIVLREIVPNILPPMIAEFSIVVPGRGHSATDGGLGFNGGGKQVTDHIWPPSAPYSGRRHCLAHGCREFCRGLVPAHDIGVAR